MPRDEEYFLQIWYDDHTGKSVALGSANALLPGTNELTPAESESAGAWVVEINPTGREFCVEPVTVRGLLGMLGDAANCSLLCFANFEFHARSRLKSCSLSQKREFSATSFTRTLPRPCPDARGLSLAPMQPSIVLPE